MAFRTVPLLLLLACSAHAPITPDAEPPAAVVLPDAASVPSPAARQATVRGLLGGARRALQRGDLDEAGRLMDQAGAEAGAEHPFVDMVVLDRAMLLAYRQDFAGAARVLSEHLSGPGVPDGSPAAFVFQNTLVMLRTAEGDLSAAVAACDAMTAAGQRAPWTADPEAITFVALKEHWHRAYLLRMLAVTQKGAARAETLRAAEKARAAYRALATPLGTHGDSIAVLDGFFAVHAHDRRAALAAARLVKQHDNDDVEDLYLTQMAFDAGGDAASAQTVREHIAGLHEISIADAVTRAWLARDGATPERQSPRHPAAPRP